MPSLMFYSGARARARARAPAKNVECAPRINSLFIIRATAYIDCLYRTMSTRADRAAI